MLCQPGSLLFFAAALYFNIILNVVSTRLSTVVCFGLNFQYHSGFCVNQASGAFCKMFKQQGFLPFVAATLCKYLFLQDGVSTRLSTVLRRFPFEASILQPGSCDISTCNTGGEAFYFCLFVCHLLLYIHGE